MKTILLTTIVALLIGLSSCNKNEDVNPEQKVDKDGFFEVNWARSYWNYGDLLFWHTEGTIIPDYEMSPTCANCSTYEVQKIMVRVDYSADPSATYKITKPSGTITIIQLNNPKYGW